MDKFGEIKPGLTKDVEPRKADQPATKQAQDERERLADDPAKRLSDTARAATERR